MGDNARSQEIYNSFRIQPLEYIVANKLGFMEGAIIKYVTRYKLNGGLSDLEKARYFIERLMLEVRSEEALEKVLAVPAPGDLKPGIKYPCSAKSCQVCYVQS